MDGKMKTTFLFVVALAAGTALGEVVPFKDAAKIKSWDAWDDAGKTPTTWKFKEKRCATLEKIRQMSSGLEPAGQLETRPAKAIRSNMWSVGCETLDRDYADWNQYAMQNVYSYFDEDVHPISVETRTVNGKEKIGRAHV